MRTGTGGLLTPFFPLSNFCARFYPVVKTCILSPFIKQGKEENCDSNLCLNKMKLGWITDYCSHFFYPSMLFVMGLWSPSQWRWSLFSHPIVFGLGHVTYFNQWPVSRHDASSGFEHIVWFGLASCTPAVCLKMASRRCWSMGNRVGRAP